MMDACRAALVKAVIVASLLSVHTALADAAPPMPPPTDTSPNAEPDDDAGGLDTSQIDDARSEQPATDRTDAVDEGADAVDMPRGGRRSADDDADRSAAASDADIDAGWLDVLLAAGGIAVFSILAYVLFRVLRRRLFTDSELGSDAGTLHGLREMHREGQLTDEEYEAAKAALIGRLRTTKRPPPSATAAPSPPARPETPTGADARNREHHSAQPPTPDGGERLEAPPHVHKADQRSTDASSDDSPKRYDAPPDRPDNPSDPRADPDTPPPAPPAP
jgi:hypothetical protein